MFLIIVALVGGLGMFIYGMNLMSRGIERVAGNKLRDILKKFTRNRFFGLVVGTFFTALIQSSSAATVMVVSFVNSGLMTLTEASGVIMGANIGTTVTAMLVAFRLGAIAPIFVFLGAIMSYYVKRPMIRKSGDIVLGFGILFLGISAMSESMSSLKEVPAVANVLSGFTNPFIGLLLGLVITSVVQSSSVTVSILVVMASQGLVDLNICLYVILGCNIGACTSALLSGLNGSKNAKRASLIHFLFNVFGSIILFVLLTFFGPQIENVIMFIAGGNSDAGSLGRNIAFAHFLFKIFMVILFYPFMNLLIKLTYVLVPGDDEEENGGQLVTRFISNAFPNPAIAVYLAVQEIYRMAHMAKDNLNLAMSCLYTVDAEKVRSVEDTELYIDFLNIKISDYLVKINQNTLPLADASRISGYFHVVSDIERIGDYADNIREYTIQMAENNVSFSDDSIAELKEMMEKVNLMIDEALEMFGEKENDIHMEEIRRLEDEVDQMEQQLQQSHIDRLNRGLCTAEAGIYFSDTVSALERIADHAINVAFAVSDSAANEKLARFGQIQLK
ncbi:MAG: Na/Pi cotransporter family protein [Lachnospiraceae bacterium]|nr:Na/Pi cotransporter family protein [Lachnospiraceae bacterium]